MIYVDNSRLELNFLWDIINLVLIISIEWREKHQSFKTYKKQYVLSSSATAIFFLVTGTIPVSFRFSLINDHIFPLEFKFI